MIAYDVQDLVKYYPGQAQPANNSLSFTVQQGEVFGLLGENGAGKSTLVRQMVNLLRSTSGSIRLYGQDVTSNPTLVAMSVGYTPQDTPALNNLSVDEAIYYTAHLRGLSSSEARRNREELLDLWQIRHLRKKYNTRLSGGERRLLRLELFFSPDRPPQLPAGLLLRQTLLGPVTGQIAVDLAVLLIAGVLAFWLVGKRLDWRIS